jgi:hypothetical protein
MVDVLGVVGELYDALQPLSNPLMSLLGTILAQ